MKARWREIGALAGFAAYADDGEMLSFQPANFLFGRATVDGRPVVLTADDFTVRGGAADASLHRKLTDAERLASEYRLPLIRMIEGTGGGGSVRTLETMRLYLYPRNPRLGDHGREHGQCAGGGAGAGAGGRAGRRAAGDGALFAAGRRRGADVRRRAAGCRCGRGNPHQGKQLGGAHIHAANGAIDDRVESEAEAFARLRRFLSYLPSSVDELPARVARSRTSAARVRTGWSAAVPRDGRKLYPIRPIVEAIVDRESWFEIGREWGLGVVTGFARIDGWPVAVVASNPESLGGLWTAATARKVERHVDLADTFHLPVVHLVDNPGFLIGRRAEDEGDNSLGFQGLGSHISSIGTLGARSILRKAYGMAGSGHAPGRSLSLADGLAFGGLGQPLPISGGLEAAYRAELEASDDPARRGWPRSMNGSQRVRSPFRTAEHYGVEAIIDPRDTRAELCEFVNMAQRALKPGRKGQGACGHKPIPLPRLRAVGPKLAHSADNGGSRVMTRNFDDTRHPHPGRAARVSIASPAGGRGKNYSCAVIPIARAFSAQIFQFRHIDKAVLAGIAEAMKPISRRPAASPFGLAPICRPCWHRRRSAWRAQRRRRDRRRGPGRWRRWR